MSGSPNEPNTPDSLKWSDISFQLSGVAIKAIREGNWKRLSPFPGLMMKMPRYSG